MSLVDSIFLCNIDPLTPRHHAGVPEGGGQQARGVRHHGAHGPRAEGQDGPQGRQAEAGRHAERAPGQVGHRVRQVGGTVRRVIKGTMSAFYNVFM